MFIPVTLSFGGKTKTTICGHLTKKAKPDDFAF
jgi:hypothetical protein